MRQRYKKRIRRKRKQSEKQKWLVGLEAVCMATLIKLLGPAEDLMPPPALTLLFSHHALLHPFFPLSYTLSGTLFIIASIYFSPFLFLKTLHHLNVRDESALSYIE